MPKPTQRDLERFRSLVPDAPGVEIKPMFGQLAAFVNGNMFMGLFGADVGVRLDQADRDLLLGEPGAGPSERPMGGYVALPDEWLDGTPSAREWIARALEDTGALPPKAPKAKRVKP